MLECRGILATELGALDGLPFCGSPVDSAVVVVAGRLDDHVPAGWAVELDVIAKSVVLVACTGVVIGSLIEATGVNARGGSKSP